MLCFLSCLKCSFFVDLTSYLKKENAEYNAIVILIIQQIFKFYLTFKVISFCFSFFLLQLIIISDFQNLIQGCNLIMYLSTNFYSRFKRPQEFLHNSSFKVLLFGSYREHIVAVTKTVLQDNFLCLAVFQKQL